MPSLAGKMKEDFSEGVTFKLSPEGLSQATNGRKNAQGRRTNAERSNSIEIHSRGQSIHLVIDWT